MTPIWLVFMNLPPNERYLPQNMILFALVSDSMECRFSTGIEITLLTIDFRSQGPVSPKT